MGADLSGHLPVFTPSVRSRAGGRPLRRLESEGNAFKGRSPRGARPFWPRMERSTLASTHAPDVLRC